ncbi:YVTN family beta-propeller protein [Humibacillus xanthopallidus]|uniref:YVTN family beta-propeller protein n=1 Tax=Humibacillus xanthopallidus TaxID=412689 RepID=A0A543PT99_9MICO|nr:YncE family protein [Humibacillus xanthopallidus]TQN47291.1 YVTN family beta-propeller protein [Humibacillus xanthopallidus]
MIRLHGRWLGSVATACLAGLVALSVGACSSPMSVAGPETAANGAASSAPAPSPSTGSMAAAGSTAGGTASAYAHTGAGLLTGAALHAKPLVYVPNQVAGTLEVIDPTTHNVVKRVRVPASPEHVVPAWDLRRLWVNSDKGNALTPIDPATGAVGTPVPVRDPYNLYFTPDGRFALVMASRFRAIDVLDAHTLHRVRSLSVPECAGVNHADFTADLRTFVASCEFNGRLLVVDAGATRVLKVLDLNAIRTPGATVPTMAMAMTGPRRGLARGASSMPQDVRLTPDGRWFMVADMLRNGVWFIDAKTLTYDHFVPTGKGAHGIYPARDAKRIFVSNRDAGTITVFDAATDRPETTWHLPGHATPDMGGVTSDGSQLWLSGRYSAAVYVIDTGSGRLIARIHTDAGPHGLLVWPQPGRFSLGHTGNMR